MKKLISLFAAILFAGFIFAEDGYGSCKVPGTSDYIEVSVNMSTEELTISNSSNRPVVSVLVSVQATEYCSKDQNGNVWSNSPVKYKVTLFNDRVWTLAPYEPKKVSFKIPSTHNYHQRWGDIEVQVSNPNCQ